jgi:hypothetical protein
VPIWPQAPIIKIVDVMSGLFGAKVFILSFELKDLKIEGLSL